MISGIRRSRKFDSRNKLSYILWSHYLEKCEKLFFKLYICVSCNYKTYFASDNDVVDVLLFAVKRHNRHDFELVKSELDQLKVGG